MRNKQYAKKLNKSKKKALTPEEKTAAEAHWTQKQKALQIRFKDARKAIDVIEAREKRGSTTDTTNEADMRQDMADKGHL